MKKKTQNDKLIDHFKHYRTITAMQAIELYGIYRLSARIHNLRECGYKIDTQPCSVVNRYGDKVHPALYVLISEPEAVA